MIKNLTKQAKGESIKKLDGCVSFYGFNHFQATELLPGDSLLLTTYIHAYIGTNNKYLINTLVYIYIYIYIYLYIYIYI